jgi:phosphate transport system protein
MGQFRGTFDRELEAIEAKVIELLGMVVEDLAVATAALLGGRRETAGVLAGRERLTDALYVEIEGPAVRAILLQAPVALDLRFLLMVLRVVPEMERSHDLVVQIASRASRVDGEDLPPKVARAAGQMADLAAVMWWQAADDWCERPSSAAAELGRPRAEMDALLAAEVAAGGMPVRTSMEMALAARDYQRLGAHALNIAARGLPGRPVWRHRRPALTPVPCQARCQRSA